MNQTPKAMKPPKSPRAINRGPQSDTAQNRRNLYQNALKKVAAALNDGYAVEAVTLVESMIADRLEARRANIHSQDRKKRMFSNLGPLVDELCGEKAGESDSSKKLYKEVANWADERNKAIHELVKLPENSEQKWDDKYAEAQTTAEKGLDLFRRLDSKIKALNRQQANK